ncbi:hypothetical protein BH11MYX4_BH11MYX4_21180 [soil metagenome]
MKIAAAQREIGRSGFLEVAHKEASQQILEAVLARQPEGKGAGQIRLLLRRLRGES